MPVVFPEPSPHVRAAAAALALLATTYGCGPSAAPATLPVRVAAASDLTAAFAEIGPAFERRSGFRVTMSFAASGLLARQIREGAPFDVFAAANESFVDDVVRSGACDASTKLRYARGHLVVWSRREARVAPPRVLSDLADARFRRIAIANPETAPYGTAAQQALRASGLWASLEPRLVFGENVRQALQLAQTGNAEVAFVARSLALGSREGTWLDVDQRLHRPLDQSLVVCRRGSSRQGGRAFAAFVGTPPARSVMRRFGFVLPEDPVVRASPTAATEQR